MQNIRSDKYPINDDTLKWLAIATMLVDHIGFLLFPQVQVLRMIGRVSFPIFAYFIAKGYRRTSDFNAYALRLGLFACLSQLPYALFIGETFPALNRPNIFFSLLLGLLILRLFHHPKVVFKLAAMPILILAEQLQLSYGAYGLFMILCFSLWENQKKPLIIAFAVLNGLYWIQNPSSPQPLSILALPIIWYLPAVQLRCPKWFAYGFYPIHLLLLVAISNWLT